MAKETTAGPKGANVNLATVGRTVRMILSFYPKLVPIVLVCILTASACGSAPAIFLQNILEVIGQYWESGDWAAAEPQIRALVIGLCCMYVVALVASFTWTRLMATVTQGTLANVREKMFSEMEGLPIRFFDTHARGDIMSYYTNDVDALRQMIGQSFPNLCASCVTMTTIMCIMLYYSVWMTLVVVCGIGVMALLTRHLGGNSARFFIRQQQAIGKAEGFVEEHMNGQKVIKVFCHEQETMDDYAVVNEELFEASDKANRYANVLGPVLMNTGNLLYVLVALAGSVMLAAGVPNISVSGAALSIAVVVPFLNMTRQFSGQIGQISHQINAIVMGLAGAERIFSLIDLESEVDNGYVSLVNVKEEDGKLVETSERTHKWAWRWEHTDGSGIDYVPLAGDMVLEHVDFGYVPENIVLHDVTIYAKPGQKVAFVGATGAGKTTITNLLNRFYDIEDGKIRYDGININKIKKGDLRRSLGMVLQDTNLFTGTVMDNIRYGRLDATDEECIQAAKLTGAHSFIWRLPDGYDTQLTDNGTNLSQGQRQLLSIARAAVADPPVMILDEATSSIDTRTEQTVQRGMDALMAGRTTFVIAHRLSTVRDADVIIVLDHGHIIERGTHDELLEMKGTYYQLYTGAFELE